MAEKLYTQADMDRRLDEARKAAREKAWLDLMGKFSTRDRRHVAGLLAHKWHIGAVTVSCDWSPSSTVYAEGQPHTGPATNEDFYAALDALEKIALTPTEGRRKRIADVLRPLLARAPIGVDSVAGGEQ